MSARDAITVIGTAIGAYFGNPQLGYAIGSAIGNAVDPQTIKGPSLGDISRQTAMEGVPRPIIWALSPPIAGNIIASSEPKIVRKRERQGKGGPKVETEHVFRTYGIGVCEGPINRFVRVWRNNTLVFDVSEFPLKTHEENVEFMKHARFVLGSFTQNADAALEREFGVGTTPAHRGTAYMVMDDEELTDLRGAIPQYIFQVERCEGFFVTSRPYSILAVDALDSYGELIKQTPAYTNPPEAIASSGSIESGVLTTNLLFYDEYPPEALDSTGTMESGILDEALITYDDYPPEALDSTGTIESGSLT